MKSIPKKDYLHFNITDFNKLVALRTTPNCTLVALWMLENADEDNLVYGRTSTFSQMFGISEDNVVRAFDELMRVRFLSKIRDNVYIVNPMIAYNGTQANQKSIIAKQQFEII